MTYDEILNSPGRQLVLFYSLTCAPCRAMKPELRALAERAGVTLREINVASEMSAVRALGIRSVPTLVKVEGGNASVMHAGALSAAALQELLAKHGMQVEGTA